MEDRTTAPEQAGVLRLMLITLPLLLLIATSCSERTIETTTAGNAADGSPVSVATVVTVVMDEPRPTPVAEDEDAGNGVDPIFEDFDPANFTNPTTIDNPWLPLTPGNRLTLDGTSIEDGEETAHRIDFVVTQMTKEIAGVESVVAWIEDYSDGSLVEAELAFYAQDDSGNVWFLGEYPEEYEDGEIVASPTWIAGAQDARAGLKMYANPATGTPAYFQGWGPAVEWSDFGVVDAVSRSLCVALGCYQDVTIIAESSLEEEGAFQLKSYARGVGNVQVDFRGDDLNQEQLEAVEFGPLSALDLERYHSAALALEASAYQTSPDVYGLTSPLKQALG